MTPRQRTVQALTFGGPDRIPLQPGQGRESTLARWRREGLPEGADPTRHLFELIGVEYEWPNHPAGGVGVDFDLRPWFEEKVLDHKDGHYIVQDYKGNICEISDEFDVTYLRNPRDFVTRAWLKCPVETRDDWEQMKERYVTDDPGRWAGLEGREAQLAERDWFLEVTLHGPFWQLREWVGFEPLCMMMVEEPAFVEEMAEFWREFISGMLRRMFRRVVPDAIRFSEDMAYKAKSMISPAMARRFCKPCWDEWSTLSRQAGVPLVGIDSDGYIGELIPIWIESGVNYCDPIEVAAHCDVNEFRRRFGRKMAYRGGVDKRCIAKGGQAIRDEIRRLKPVVRGGGYIPGCDHGVPSDVSWPSFVEYGKLLAEVTGWL